MIKKSKKSTKPVKIKSVDKSLNEFYSEEQKQEDHKQAKRKEHQEIEMEIFEHLKNHTKKVLNAKK